MWLRFIFASLLFMFVGRKSGWALSRALLYTAPTYFTVGLCLLWGLVVACAIRGLIIWFVPGAFVRWVFGYLLGWYVAVPNCGLFIESTIPEAASDRHALISVLPVVAYILASVAFGLGVFSL